MKSLQQILKEKIHKRLSENYSVESEEIIFSVPPDRKFGDLSSTLPFVISKKVKKKPFAIGQEIKRALDGEFEFIEKMELAGGGFLNFHLNRDFIFRRLVQESPEPSSWKKRKVVVEHTSINPNKSAHIGHLRNSCLGDTLAKGYLFLGHAVEVQNYIDDTGIQMADVVWGLLYHKKKNLEQVKQISRLAEYLWKLYPEVSQIFEQDENLARQRNEVHKKIEEKINPEYDVCRYVAHEILIDHIKVMEGLGIRYDLLIHESDIIARGLFEEASALLKEKNIMYLSADPEKKGCWVIYYDREKIEKIIIRSNGTITYVGKDIAYNLWKFGLLERDFYYEPFFRYPDGHEIKSTTMEPRPASRTHLARTERVYNVIDVRQSYLQSIINQVLAQLGHEKESKNFIHYAYEMVALTPTSVKDLGMEISSEEEKKPYIAMSGRKGSAVRADQLIEMLVAKSMQEVRMRHPELDEGTAGVLARKIAVGALRYFMIKYHLNTVIAFDFKEALSFEGDTGPYLQYTLVRINSILSKLPPSLVLAPELPALKIMEEKEAAIFWEIILQLSLLELQVEHSLENLDLSSLAAYANSLCQKMNHYYHLFSVIAEENVQLRELRLHLILMFKKRIERLLYIMGIQIPEKM